MRDEFRDLARGDTVVECEVQMIGKLDRLVPSDECRERDHAAVARCKTRTFPEVAEQTPLSVVFERWCYGANVVCRYGAFNMCVRRHDLIPSNLLFEPTVRLCRAFE